eukprot:COSAG02_NODE_20_length_53673_cov_86.864841_5_plen_43_part_00
MITIPLLPAFLHSHVCGGAVVGVVMVVVVHTCVRTRAPQFVL